MMGSPYVPFPFSPCCPLFFPFPLLFFPDGGESCAAASWPSTFLSTLDRLIWTSILKSPPVHASTGNIYLNNYEDVLYSLQCTP